MAGFFANSQVSFTVLAPGGIAGDYNFEWADPAGGDWSCPDFTVAGTYIQGFLAMAEDGTAGTSTYGHPISQQACNPLDNMISDVTGKIAVLYRGDCEFGAKALNAETAGAIGVIIINHTGDAVPMGGGTNGTSVTIPVVMLSEADGAMLVTEMGNGPVEVFIGNKLGLYTHDAGAIEGEMIVSDFGGAHSAIYDGFTPGVQVYNWGSATNDISATATITSPGGSADYSSSVGPITLNSGDTVSIFAGNTDEFAAWNLGVGNYPNGEYTLTYDITIAGQTDEADYDNTYSYTFWVNDNVISLSNLDGSDMVQATDYPFNATQNYQACMMFQEPNASALGVRGMYFIPYTDTSLYILEGAEVLLYAYQWDDTWVDVTNPGFTAFTEYVQNLNTITTGSYVVGSDDETGDVAYEDFDTPFVLQDNVRYLFCLESTDLVNELSFGYDGTIEYGGNYGIYLQPISPVYVDATWYTGWSGLSAPSIGLRTFDPSELGMMESTEKLFGSAYPNPANDMVTITVSGEGDATVVVTDLAGKVAMTNNVTLANNSAMLSIDSLESGIYIFNVTLENGQTAIFNVAKK